MSSVDRILWEESTVDIDILEVEDVAIDIGTEATVGNKFLLADDNPGSGSDDDAGQDRCRDCGTGENVTPSLEITSLCFSLSCLTRFPF